ncbi:tumor necrosis factor receptor superfamily member 4 isoform X3 [Suricata suricatta]|uniref:tumor necrosis factor receptor superfamily member 4 isoform X3 n=1 Tax=Suricata suricatta TaxID=37032 RepID=UPI001155B715|nr:tumor necrosis factor receptor superfamily member 4 isoform X3 [Suricata suricatta]
MRMLVEAQQLRVPRSAVLLLGLALGTAARLDCVGNTYPKDGRCCSECPPGYGMESRCRANQDTKCRQCLAGFYNEAMNYEPCKPCTQCNQTVPAYLTPPQEVGVRPSRGAHPRRTRSAAVVRAPSPRMVTISELTVPLAHRGTSPQVTTRLASPGPSPQLAAVLGLGLGLLAPVAAALALLLHHRAWRLPPGGNSIRTPIQEEQADANSSLAKI